METNRIKLSAKEIVKKKIDSTIGQEAFDRLIEMRVEDLTSILLGLYEARVEKMTPKSALKQFQNDRFLKVSAVSQNRFTEFDYFA